MFVYSNNGYVSFAQGVVDFLKATQGTHRDFLITIYKDWNSYPGNVSLINRFLNEKK